MCGIFQEDWLTIAPLLVTGISAVHPFIGVICHKRGLRIGRVQPDVAIMLTDQLCRRTESNGKCCAPGAFDLENSVSWSEPSLVPWSISNVAVLELLAHRR